RINVLTERRWLDAATAARLKRGAALLPAERADRMIENDIGVFGLPLAVAPNFLINGRDYVVPMVVEEASVVAAVSASAKLARASGGFNVDVGESLLVGQVLVTGVPDADAAMSVIEREAEELIALANSLQPNLVARGGGARGMDIFRARFPTGGATEEPRDDNAIILHLLVATRDAMGANTVRTMRVVMAGREEALTSGMVVMTQRSRLAVWPHVSAPTSVPASALAERGRTGEGVRDAIVVAGDFA